MQTQRRCGIYARLSEDREGTGWNVDEQVEACRALAAQRGWTVAATYVDNDTPATDTGGRNRRRPRHQYRRLIEAVEAGELDAIVVKHADRLYRQPVELERLINLAEGQNVALATVTGDLNLSTPNGRLVARLLVSVAAGEVETKSDRQKVGIARAAQEGRWGGGARPFGYEAGAMTLRESEAEEVRRLTRAVLDGESLGSLVRDLNARGITTSVAKPWGYAQLRQLLLRARNAGLREHRGELFPAAWPAIVSEAEWRQVRALLGQPGRRKSLSNAHRWLLSGIARCGVCGATMRSASVTNRGGAKRNIYRCSQQSGKHVFRAAEEMDALATHVVLRYLEKPARSGQPEPVLRELDEAVPETAGNTALFYSETVAATLPSFDVVADARAALADVEQLRTSLDQLATLLAERVLTVEAVRRESERLREKLADAESRLAMWHEDSPLRQLITARGADRDATWAGLTLRQRRAVVDELMSITVLPLGRGAGKRFRPESVRIEPKGAGTAALALGA